MARIRSRRKRKRIAIEKEKQQVKTRWYRLQQKILKSKLFLNNK
jgi:hypothetical protein